MLNVKVPWDTENKTDMMCTVWKLIFFKSDIKPLQIFISLFLIKKETVSSLLTCKSFWLITTCDWLFGSINLREKLLWGFCPWIHSFHHRLAMIMQLQLPQNWLGLRTCQIVSGSVDGFLLAAISCHWQQSHDENIPTRMRQSLQPWP